MARAPQEAPIRYTYFVVRNTFEGAPNIVADKTYSLEEAVKAQKALRTLAGMGPEAFPIQAFVGMISDEIEELRKQGHGDEEIAKTIKSSSAIEITPAEIAENYASPDERHPH